MSEIERYTNKYEEYQNEIETMIKFATVLFFNQFLAFNTSIS